MNEDRDRLAAARGQVALLHTLLREVVGAAEETLPEDLKARALAALDLSENESIETISAVARDLGKVTVDEATLVRMRYGIGGKRPPENPGNGNGNGGGNGNGNGNGGGGGLP